MENFLKKVIKTKLNILVSRIGAKSEIYEIEMQLDVNFEIYSMDVNKVFL